MSQAFVRESDDDIWLNEVKPSLNALIHFLTRENGGIRVYEVKTIIDNEKEIHVMSNGLSYAKNDKGEWEIVQ